MFTRIAAGVLLALLMDAAPAQDAAAAEDATAVEMELVIAEAKAILQSLPRVYEIAGPVFRDLSVSTAPRDWMLASQLQTLLDPLDPAYSGKVRAELLRNAAAAAPDDALVQWVAMTAMPGDGGKVGCAAPAGLPANIDNVLRLESDNGLAWLPVLSHAYQNDDALGMDAALARMAAAERFDDHVDDFAKVLAQFHADHPQLLQTLSKIVREADPRQPPQEPGDEVSAEAFGIMEAERVSPYPLLLLSVCGGDPQSTPLQPTRRAICADVAQRMLRLGKSSDLQTAGLSLLHQLGERDTAAEAAAREYQWLTSVIFQSPDVDNDVAAEWLRSGNEQQAMRTVAQARGLPLTPPPFWQPEELSYDPDDDALDADEEAADAAAGETDAEADPSAAAPPDERF
ncbi:hypothetical protein [Tahibacter harae]|uniref:HEAT repeat domain-containing protein n=1 Tax=Tahibacter harae TaxID=2963937 RepID=A0ABT1QUJ1_9GAMM|nr:hypothetical protein [Tahibacter harae]MCQ4165936.1 hypothetical protein [Tahibacter harae]